MQRARRFYYILIVAEFLNNIISSELYIYIYIYIYIVCNSFGDYRSREHNFGNNRSEKRIARKNNA